MERGGFFYLVRCKNESEGIMGKKSKKVNFFYWARRTRVNFNSFGELISRIKYLKNRHLNIDNLRDWYEKKIQKEKKNFIRGIQWKK